MSGHLSVEVSTRGDSGAALFMLYFNKDAFITSASSVSMYNARFRIP